MRANLEINTIACFHFVLLAVYWMRDLKQAPFVSLTFHITACAHVKICTFPRRNLEFEQRFCLIYNNKHKTHVVLHAARCKSNKRCPFCRISSSQIFRLRLSLLFVLFHKLHRVSSLKQIPTDPRPQVVICVVRRSDVTLCKVTQWKLRAFLGHLFCPYKMLNSLTDFFASERILSVAMKAAQKLNVHSAQAGACLIMRKMKAHLEKQTHNGSHVHVVCLSILSSCSACDVQQWQWSWQITSPISSCLYSPLIFQAAESTCSFVGWETLPTMDYGAA